jgi:hypothetical protein
VKPGDEAWSAIGLKKDSFEDFKDKVFEEIEKAKIFLKI